MLHWELQEVVMQGFASRNMSLAIALGVLGGTALVLSARFFASGKFLLVPYSAFVIATICVIRAERVSGFFERFAIGAGSFLIASVALYVANAVSPAAAQLAIGGHAWRLAFLVALSIAVNLPAARLAAPPPMYTPSRAAA